MRPGPLRPEGGASWRCLRRVGGAARAGEAAGDGGQRRALAKAMPVGGGAALPGAGRAGPLRVLGADPAVVIDGEMRGKPADRSAALRMLARLSGRTHEVLTAVALVGPQGSAQRLSRSEVSFRELAQAECA